MTEQRTGEDRRLASQKQQTLTGGDVNYYLTELWDTVVVETEDVIELLHMPFNMATTFKSTCRLCKLRMDLGKPGSTVDYEVGKIVYYNKRVAAVSLRREKSVGWIGRSFRYLRDMLHRGYFDNVNEVVLDVPEPKRLDPYSFRVGDFIDALQPSPAERRILENTFRIALMRLVVGPTRADEIEVAHDGVVLAYDLKKMTEEESTHVPSNA